MSESTTRPSTRNSAFLMPFASEASAENVISPRTSALSSGAVSVTLGAVVSTTKVRLAGLGSVLPAASVERTRKVCSPSERPL